MFENFYFLFGIVNSLLLITIFSLVSYAKATQVAVAGKVYLARRYYGGFVHHPDHRKYPLAHKGY